MWIIKIIPKEGGVGGGDPDTKCSPLDPPVSLSFHVPWNTYKSSEEENSPTCRIRMPMTKSQGVQSLYCVPQALIAGWSNTTQAGVTMMVFIVASYVIISRLYAS